MLRSLLVTLALCIGATATDAEPRFDRTCTYFAGVAYNDRFTRPAPTFRTRVADDCADALGQLAAARPGTVRHALAANYLRRLDAYRGVLIAMARERFAAARAGTSARPMPFRPVSRTGAYLIAKSMGVVEIQARWHERRIALAEGRVVELQ